MWDNESERIGKRMCSPTAYKLHGISDGIGFISLLMFLCSCAYLVFRYLADTFSVSLLIFPAIPIATGFLGSILYRYSWKLVERKEWSYNYEKREASWLENGQKHKYCWEAEHVPPVQPRSGAH